MATTNLKANYKSNGILNVNKDADQQTIKNAYVKKVIDAQFSGNMSSNQNDDLAEAYQVLSDNNLRQQYDQDNSNFDSDNTHKFKSGNELYQEKSKDPSFFQINESHTYTSTEQHTYKDGKHFAQKHSIENWTDGEKKEGKKVDREIVYKNGQPVEVVTESVMNQDGTVSTQRKELMDDGQGNKKVVSIQNDDQQSN